MLAKIVGAVVLVGGVVLGASLLLPLLGMMVSGVWVMLKLTVLGVLVGALLFCGWRWVNSPSALAKVAGAFLLVGGIWLSFSLVGGIISGIFGLLGFALVVGLVLGLIYWGWRWINGRSLRRSDLGKY